MKSCMKMNEKIVQFMLSVVQNGLFTAPYLPRFTHKRGIWRCDDTFV